MRLPVRRARRCFSRLGVAVLLLALVLPVLPAPVALAAPTCLVNNLNDSGAESLRQCLLDVDAGGTITFSIGSGTITLASNLAALSKAVTIIWPGASNLTINRNNTSGTIFTLNNGGSLTANGLTLTGANIAVTVNTGGSLALTDSTISGNANHGVFIPGGSATLTSSSLSNNGLGLQLNGGGATLTEVTVSNNSNTGVQVLNGTATITDSILNGNASNGGVQVQGGSATIARSTLSGNSVGVWLQGGSATLTNVAISGSTSSNLLVQFGAVATVTDSTISGSTIGVSINNGAVATLTGTTISGQTNTALEVEGASATLANSTVTGSLNWGVRVKSGGGAVLRNSTLSDNDVGALVVDADGSATVTNTLLAANTNGNCFGTITNGGHNLDDGTTCGFGNANNSLSSTPGGLDPAGLQDNGGPSAGTAGNSATVPTISLLATSAARNAGDDELCVATGPGQVNSVDQRGFSRPSGGQCDIGASESDGTTFLVSSLDNTGAGTLRAGWGNSAVGTILFPPELSGGTIGLLTDLPGLARAVRLVGLSPEPVNIVRTTEEGGNVFRVDNGGSLTASNLRLTGGATDKGVITGGFLRLSNVTISGFDKGIEGSGTLTLTNSTVSGNGTGVEQIGLATLINSTISGNGTGVKYSGNTGATLVNTTVSGNGTGVSHTGTGVTSLYNVTLSGNGTAVSRSAGEVYLSNTLVANSTTANCAGTFMNVGHNLDSGTSCGFGSANGSLSSTPAGLDPVGLRDNGGPTRTIALLPTSAAIDAGDAAICAEIGPPSLIVNGVDQRGVSRPQGAGCDIGAFEFRPACEVTTLGDTGVGSLRQCLLGMDDGGTITVAVTGTITLASDLPPVTKAVTIAGPGANLLTIHRADTGEGVIFTVNTGGHLLADGLTLTGAFRGVAIASGSATLSNVTLSDSTTGVHLQGGTATLTNATLNGNGESLFITAFGNATLTNATLSDSGTGVSVNGGGSATLTNVTISGNGTGISVDSATATLTNTIVANSSNDDCTGSITNVGHNLDTDGSCGYEGANGSLSDIPAGLNPAGLQANGGQTRTIALLPTSAALNAGDDTVCAVTGPGKVNGVDQRGVVRPQGVRCDIGAYELQLPEITALNPASMQVGSPAFTLTVTGTKFQADSVVHWQGDALDTTFVSATSVTATVPVGLLTVATTAEVTVVTPSAGGSTTPAPFFVTIAVAPVTAVDSSYNAAPGGTALASVGGDPGSEGSVSAEASGTGTVSVAQFANPPAPPPLGATTVYSDIYLSEGNTFTSVTIVNCNITRVSVVYWWDGTRWVRINPQSYDNNSGCITITISATSTPSLADLTGTYIAAIEGPPATLTLTTAGTGSGTVGRNPEGIGEGPFDHDLDSTVTLTAVPNAGSTFVGWTVDGVYRGWANPLTLTMDAAHTVQATFTPTRTFADTGSTLPEYAAVVALATRGYILGLSAQEYGPSQGVQRAQMAALISRATPAGPGTPPNTAACVVPNSWDCEDWGNSFQDRGGLIESLWRNAGTLQHYKVAFGYDGPACAARNVPSPCYAPGAPVTHAETIAFITRAMQAKGYWQPQPNAPLPDPSVPGVLATEAKTYAYYTGSLLAPPPGTGWNDGATRGWFARALWQALNSYWGTDGNLADGRPAGGMVP